MIPIDKTVEPIPVLEAVEQVNTLACLAFFPSETEARAAIAEELVKICPNLNEARWLMARFRQLFNKWPGPRELRAVYCSRNKPRDGYEVVSDHYPDGVPVPPAGSELSCRPALESPQYPALPPGHVITADPMFENDIRELAAKLSMTRVKPERVTNPNFKPITQADIDRAAQDYRNEKAKSKQEPTA